jgi:general secretion pathway protein G
LINYRISKKELVVKKAFSLIEIMIVIIILGLLASVVMPDLVGKAGEAKQKLVCVQMKNVSEALKMFKLDNGLYPDTEEGLDALIQNPDEEKYPNYASKPYFEESKMPKDPWKRKFIYLKNEDGFFEIISLGADGREGGDGEEKDTKYSECK